jgi:Flp pilus assembly protein TadG
MAQVARSFSRFARCRDAATAVEFALVFPIFLIVLFGIISFGAYLGVVHGVQQIAAEAARAAVAGITDAERVSLAQNNINANIASYPLIAPARLTLDSAATDPATSVFAITVRYDASDMFIFNLPNFVPAPAPTIIRSAAIQRGGY